MAHEIDANCVAEGNEDLVDEARVVAEHQALLEVAHEEGRHVDRLREAREELVHLGEGNGENVAVDGSRGNVAYVKNNQKWIKSVTTLY